MVEQTPIECSEKEVSYESWVVIKRPGYLGSRKEEMLALWNELYGEGNWRFSWQTADRNRLDFQDIFNLYVQAYVEYFKRHPNEARFLAERYSYAYDETLVSKEKAFDLYALWEKAGVSNQFHHVALNVALEKELKIPFIGDRPVQVRGGKPGTPKETWPKGWRWHPGRIPCPEPDLIPRGVTHERKWWDDDSIEDFYQSTKVLEVKEFALK